MRAVRKGGSQYLDDLRSGKVDYLKLLTAFAGCRPNPIEVWWQEERDDSCLQETTLRQASSRVSGVILR